MRQQIRIKVAIYDCTTL